MGLCRVVFYHVYFSNSIFFFTFLPSTQLPPCLCVDVSLGNTGQRPTAKIPRTPIKCPPNCTRFIQFCVVTLIMCIVYVCIFQFTSDHSKKSRAAVCVHTILETSNISFVVRVYYFGDTYHTPTSLSRNIWGCFYW